MPHLHNRATDPRGQGGEPLPGMVEVALISTPIRSVLHLKPASAKTQHGYQPFNNASPAISLMSVGDLHGSDHTTSRPRPAGRVKSVHIRSKRSRMTRKSDPDLNVYFRSENGLIGCGEYPDPGHEDPDLINAGKETLTVKKGGVILPSSQAIGVIRGGHLDMSILGGLQVAQNGDLANLIIAGKLVDGMGGALDLVSSQALRTLSRLGNASKNLHPMAKEAIKEAFDSLSKEE